MQRFINRFKEEYRKEGLKVALAKTAKNFKIRSKRKLTLNTRSYNNWKNLKDAYKGKRVFLIGNGPSLNKTPLYLLDHEYTMCFNRFNIMYERLQWRPSFYMCVDALVAEDMASEINDIVREVELAFFPDIHTHGLDFRKFIKDQDNIQWLFPEFKGFYFNLPKVALGGTVAYPALQVLTYLGFSEIYLIGVDMNYQIHTTVKDIKDRDVASTKDDDPNHFDPRYFGKDRKYHQPVKATQDNMMYSMEFAASQIKKHSHVKVYNAGINSQVNCFERINFEGLFHYSPDQLFHLFAKGSEQLSKYKNAEALFASIPHIVSKEQIQRNEMFSCSLEEGGNWLKDLIFDFIPYGPYQDKMIFIARNKPLIKY